MLEQVLKNKRKEIMSGGQDPNYEGILQEVETVEEVEMEEVEMEEVVMEEVVMEEVVMEEVGLDNNVDYDVDMVASVAPMMDSLPAVGGGGDKQDRKARATCNLLSKSTSWLSDIADTFRKKTFTLMVRL